MTSFRPSQADLVRLKTPLGELLKGMPSDTMPKLKILVQERKPPKVITVGDIVTRESLKARIPVSLKLVDQMTLRKVLDHFEIKTERTYRVRNPAGVITQEAWDTIKEALRQRDAVIFVDGEEDLLAIPTIIESPENSFVVYGQPSEGLVVVTATVTTKAEVKQMVDRMTKE